MMCLTFTNITSTWILWDGGDIVDTETGSIIGLIVYSINDIYSLVNLRLLDIVKLMGTLTLVVINRSGSSFVKTGLNKVY